MQLDDCSDIRWLMSSPIRTGARYFSALGYQKDTQRIDKRGCCTPVQDSLRTMDSAESCSHVAIFYGFEVAERSQPLATDVAFSRDRQRPCTGLNNLGVRGPPR